MKILSKAFVKYKILLVKYLIIDKIIEQMFIRLLNLADNHC